MIESELSDHIFITFGCDFSYSNSQRNYEQLDDVINDFNQNNPGI